MTYSNFHLLKDYVTVNPNTIFLLFLTKKLFADYSPKLQVKFHLFSYYLIKIKTIYKILKFLTVNWGLSGKNINSITLYIKSINIQNLIVKYQFFSTLL